MLFFLEFHSNRNVQIDMDQNQCLFTLFFVTFGGVAMTIQDIQEGAAQVMADQLQTSVAQFGEAGLNQKVEAALRKAGLMVEDEVDAGV